MSNEAVIAAQVKLARLEGVIKAKMDAAEEDHRAGKATLSPASAKRPATLGDVWETQMSAAEIAGETAALLSARIALLEAKLAEIETRGLQFRGAYQRALTYRCGDVTVYKGTPWAALSETIETPGTGRAWQQLMRPGGSE